MTRKAKTNIARFARASRHRRVSATLERLERVSIDIVARGRAAERKSGREKRVKDIE